MSNLSHVCQKIISFFAEKSPTLFVCLKTKYYVTSKNDNERGILCQNLSVYSKLKISIVPI